MSKSRKHTAALETPEWLPQCIEHTLGFALEKRSRVETFIPPLLELSSRFLDENVLSYDEERHYYEDDRLRQAYFLYYTTSNFLKLGHPLNELFRSSAFSARKDMSVLELGCGTGTGIIGMQAWRESRPDAPSIRYTATDAFSGSLRFVEKLLRSLPGRQGMSVDTRQCDLDHPVSLTSLRERYDLILVMNAINELRPATLEALPKLFADLLNPTGMVLMIEPALRHTSRALLQLRDAMTQKDWTVFAPCYTQQRCPALRDTRDWCHHEEYWNRPLFIQWLDELLHNVKLSLKYSYMLMNRHGDTLDRHTSMPGKCGRVVSSLFEEKGRARVFVCSNEGRKHYLKNNRDNCEGNAAFDQLNRYDTVSISGTTQRQNDALVTRESRVVKVDA
jgi:ribosomal protein RSM22 (predicted rRNA methylase)